MRDQTISEVSFILLSNLIPSINLSFFSLFNLYNGSHHKGPTMDPQDGTQSRANAPSSRKAKQNKRSSNRHRRKKQFQKADKALEEGKDLTGLNNVQQRYLSKEYPNRFPDWTHLPESSPENDSATRVIVSRTNPSRGNPATVRLSHKSVPLVRQMSSLLLIHGPLEETHVVEVCQQYT